MNGKQLQEVIAGLEVKELREMAAGEVMNIRRDIDARRSARLVSLRENGGTRLFGRHNLDPFSIVRDVIRQREQFGHFSSPKRESKKQDEKGDAPARKSDLYGQP